MRLHRIGLLVCSLTWVFAPAIQAQPITLRITGDGEAGESINTANGTPFTLDITFNELIRQDADEMTSIFTSAGSVDFSAGSITSFFEDDEFIISAEKSVDGFDLTLNGGSLLHDLTINKHSPAAGMSPVRIDDLVGYYIDGNNQDSHVILGLNALIVDSSTATFGGDITSITRVSGPSLLDFNNDSSVDVLDLDMLVAELFIARIPPLFLDISRDGLVNKQDVMKWLADAGDHNGFSEAYLSGDSNLDGSVDAADLNRLALSWQQDVALWSGGNFTADGTVNSADLNELAINWQRSIPMASAASTQVPEPSAWLLAIFGLFVGWRRKLAVESHAKS